MTDIEAKALALVNDVREELKRQPFGPELCGETFTALCRAIERHEAYEQKVSDTLQEYIECFSPPTWHRIDQFIIPKPKPDPLVELVNEVAKELHITGASSLHTIRADIFRNKLRAALGERGWEIREKGK